MLLVNCGGENWGDIYTWLKNQKFWQEGNGLTGQPTEISLWPCNLTEPTFMYASVLTQIVGESKAQNVVLFSSICFCHFVT